MNRWKYRLEIYVGCWIFLFTVIGGILVLLAWIGTIESSTPEALWDAVISASIGTLITYLYGVLFFSVIKEKDKTNKAFERLKEKG